MHTATVCVQTGQPSPFSYTHTARVWFAPPSVPPSWFVFQARQPRNASHVFSFFVFFSLPTRLPFLPRMPLHRQELLLSFQKHKGWFIRFPPRWNPVAWLSLAAGRQSLISFRTQSNMRNVFVARKEVTATSMEHQGLIRSGFAVTELGGRGLYFVASVGADGLQ